MTIARLFNEIKQRQLAANVANSASTIPTNKPVLAKLAIEIDVPVQSTDIFEAFFEQAKQAGLELLHDDKRWLRSLGYSQVNTPLLSEYITRWLDGMKQEEKTFKKQNKGRWAANTYIREALQNDK
ncbi:hypothetical protein Lste_2454 [Legionella steelei]|uniref:Uncharacterized protein n=1 Tax=Legionella steelei TaxID=947033 RepID=A0A0W0ZJZ7_9GAMM|nr:hypothetical protein [Legionella steelei]KTD69296.1 hypothetical protein Lste_2454 [Legionella steelei]